MEQEVFLPGGEEIASTKCKFAKVQFYTQRGYFHIRRSGGGLAPNFASAIHVGVPNFASKNIGDSYPKFCPLNFRYNPKCPQNCDSFPIFASCSNRTP